MKILIATDCYVYNMAGVTASILALTTGLRQLGHEVRILSPSYNYKSFRNADDFFIKSIPALYYPKMRLIMSLSDPLIKTLEDWSPDVIHAQTEGAAFIVAKKIAKCCGAPIVMTSHTNYGHYAFGKFQNLLPFRTIMSLVGTKVYRSATSIVAPSQKAANFNTLSRLQEKVVVVPNGMEIEKYQKKLSINEKNELKSSLGIDDNKKIMVSVSRISKEKNLQEIIYYFKEYIENKSDYILLVVGDGPDRERLERLTKRLQLEDDVIFTGAIPATEVWKYYDLGDVFVSASTFEVHSMSYLEALANGLPMLCRADDALVGVVEHGKNGLIYNTKEEFFKYADDILEDDSLRESMANYSAESALRFTVNVFADSILKVYESSISAV